MSLTTECGYPTPLSNSTLLPLLLLSLATQRHTPKGSSKFKNEYDYIIVGAGSAGSVVASRLSELPCVSVLLLEAGKKPPLLTEVPSLGRYLYKSDVDWGYKSVPQKYTAAGYVNRQLPWAAGKMLGGSSSLNSMLYVRGNKKNFDDWEDMGATGWSYNDVFRYFLKLEDNRNPQFLSNGYHTFGGPITAEQPRYYPELKKAVYEVTDELGYQILDSNAARQTGFYDHQASIRNNQRCSTAKAYLVPAENRANLDIIPEAMVTRILIEEGEAKGVQLDFNGVRYEVKASREVILSAGTINTPQILKLSGIGPAYELQMFNRMVGKCFCLYYQFNADACRKYILHSKGQVDSKSVGLLIQIPVVADLPVGENFQNHGGIQYPFVLNPHIPDFDEKLSNTQNINEYIYKRTGPLSSNDGYYFTSFLKGLATFSIEDCPNVEIYITETSISILKKSGLKPEVYQQIFGPYEDQAIFTCTVQQVQPKSRGTVSLRSSNPYDPPLIEPNYLADPRDVEDIVKGLKVCRRIVTSESFRKLGASPLQTLIPGCEGYADYEDEYLECQARTLLFTFHHPAGTAKMGSSSDPSTVVDSELKVKNVKRLRVIDASVMPIVTSGNTNIPTIMIAEKASDMIKETVNCFGNLLFFPRPWYAFNAGVGDQYP